MAVESITKTLGSGSGIDLKALVTSLVDAQYAAKTAQFTAKSDALTAQISGVAKLKSAITGFDSALKSLVKGGTLATQPISSDTKVLATSLLSGGTAPTGPTTLTVTQLAAAQTDTTRAVAAAERFAKGTLTVTIGSGTPQTVDIAEGATLAEVAAAIKTRTGLSAAIVADGDNSRLTLKGATGAGQAFTIIAAQDTGATDADAAGNLGAFVTGSASMTRGAEAKDANVRIDGVTYSRSSNTINNLVPGVKLELAGTGTTTIAATRPTAALSQAMSDVVATFNELQTVLKEQTNAASGALKSDSAATNIARALATLTTTRLATGTVQTLADVGVSTNRDGTLSVDSARLAKVLANDPASVEALFADGTGASGGGLSAALSAVATRLTDKNFGLDAATTRYTKQQKDLADAKDDLDIASAATSERMTKQFARMDARVAAYKSTQTFLTNQIAAWNKSDS